jgi:hypothetical protein
MEAAQLIYKAQRKNMAVIQEAFRNIAISHTA